MSIAALSPRPRSLKRVCIIATRLYVVEVSLLHQIRSMSQNYDVTVVVDSGPQDFFSRHQIRATLRSVPMERRPSPVKDLLTLYRLIRTFRRDRFDMIHSFTPKAGLLSMLAGWCCRVPVRIHTFTGQVWVTRTGMARRVLQAADRLLSSLATAVLVDSHSQRRYLMSEHIVSAAKSRVLANGSNGGCDPNRFRPSATTRAALRREFGIPDEAIVFLFIARLNRDKGALIIAEAFSAFNRRDGAAHLFVVGADEGRLRGRIVDMCRDSVGHVHFVDHTTEPERYYAGADVVCLPSYREGFPTVALEAGAAGLPIIASRIYGCTDAVVDGMTGLLHDVGGVDDLVGKMRRLAADPGLRAEMGRNGMMRVRREFTEDRVTGAVMAFYDEALAPCVTQSLGSMFAAGRGRIVLNDARQRPTGGWPIRRG